MSRKTPPQPSDGRCRCGGTVENCRCGDEKPGHPRRTPPTGAAS